MVTIHNTKKIQKFLQCLNVIEYIFCLTLSYLLEFLKFLDFLMYDNFRKSDIQR